MQSSINYIWILAIVVTMLPSYSQSRSSKAFYIQIDGDDVNYQGNKPYQEVTKIYSKGLSFVLSYNCKCYVRDHPIDFYFRGKEEDVKILPTAPKGIMKLNDFAAIAVKARAEFKNINSETFWLVEKLNSKAYLYHRVVFLAVENDE